MTRPTLIPDGVWVQPQCRSLARTAPHVLHDEVLVWKVCGEPLRQFRHEFPLMRALIVEADDSLGGHPAGGMPCDQLGANAFAAPNPLDSNVFITEVLHATK